ncbi:MAG: energy-coupling factor transporter ATPase [Oscillospiraceae bacterium]|nr:energy-coupling factor transporter ATPase [Oscillospiraceae bacterium]
MGSIIEFDHVTYRYPEGEQDSLSDICLSIEEGSFTAVLGHNGSGKSTLAKHMNAILTPTAGKVLVDGMDTADENLLLKIRRTVGMVFQNPDNQIVSNVVEEDVAFAPENLGIEPEEIRSRVDEALRLTGMYEYRMHAPHLLSGGQKQRVAIAGVLAMKPRLIVLDEPTAMLDPLGRREVIETVQRLRRERGMTVVLITHHMDECVQADRLVVMSNATIIADGKPEEVFSHVELMEREGLDVPETVKLLYDLNRKGIRLPLTVLRTAECAETVINALGYAGAGADRCPEGGE